MGLADLFSGHDNAHKVRDMITGDVHSRALRHPLEAKMMKVVDFKFLFPAGDLLIIMAQIIVSVQMVLEEKFVYKHDVHPLRAVGTEGTSIETLASEHVSCRNSSLQLLHLPSVSQPLLFSLLLMQI